MERTITIQQIKDVAQEAYNLYKDNTDGKNADYIPYLANIDPKLFGISICLMNGEIIQLGDSQYRFGIESVSKVLTAILVLRQYGAPKVLEMIGADATGLPFNSIMAILLENDHPSTPLVNAGAISANSMVQPVGNSDAKWKAIVDNMTELCGSTPQLIDELYRSESATNFNNRSIAYTNNALDGDGPIAPERAGTVPAGALVNLCFSGKYSQRDVLKMLAGKGGLVAHLNQNSVQQICIDIEKGDQKSKAVLDAMSYSIAKEIGAMAAVLKGQVDAILLTGGVAYNEPVNDVIREHCSFLAPIFIYPGEDEMGALMLNALSVLRGERTPKVYA